MASNSMETTVDPKEMEAFQDLSLVWWKKKGLQLLQLLNEKIINYIVQQLLKIGVANKNVENTLEPLRGLTVLEVGCGGGFLSEYLAQTGCVLTGIDPNEDLVKVAKDHGAADPTLSKITYLRETIEEYCKNHEEQFDVVVSNFVLEHVSDPDYFIRCCSKCVKPGGSLFISTIAKTYLAWFIHIFLYEYVLRLLPIGIHHLDKFINAPTTETIIKSCDFKIEHTQGFWYDFMTRKVYHVPIHSNVYMVHAVNQK